MRNLNKSRQKAFTLIEVMVAMGVFTLLGSMILTLILSTTRSLFDSTNKGSVDRSFRATTSSLSQLVGCCDFLYIFTRQIDDSNKQTDVQVRPDMIGDYLVTVYYQNPGRIDPATGLLDTTVARVAGICRFPSDTGGKSGPIYMFDSAVNNWGRVFPAPSNNTTKSITDLLPNAAQIRSFTKLADQAFSSNATSGNTDAGIFKNIDGSGALMMARIRMGWGGKYVSSAYSFSISSRNL